MDRRKRKTQAAITQALLSQLQKSDFATITVSQLCELADINRGTFYLNYLDKFDLLERVIQTEIDTLITYCQTSEKTSQPLTATFAYLTEHKNRFSLLIKAGTQDVFSSYLVRYLLKSELANASSSQTEAIFIANGVVGVLKNFLLNPKSNGNELIELEVFIAKFKKV